MGGRPGSPEEAGTHPPEIRSLSAGGGARRFLFRQENAGVMADSEPCELHEVAMFTGEGGSEDLLRLARSPIGDECQICPVCRAAREFVERRLAEQSGFVPPPGESAEASWAKLQTAVQGAKTTIHRTA